ncbi:MAG: hypothetical protein ACXAB7_01825 [Candidatus Kariarchaeaceae archaeon]|jgi:hypothetical protein
MLIYESKRKLRNLWQSYKIYDDRIELRFWLLLKTLHVRRDEINWIEVRPPIVIFDKLRKRYRLRDLFRAVKLDFADFSNHVVIELNRKIIKQYRFTPDDPQEFVKYFSLKGKIENLAE